MTFSLCALVRLKILKSSLKYLSDSGSILQNNYNIYKHNNNQMKNEEKTLVIYIMFNLLMISSFIIQLIVSYAFSW